MKGLGLGSIVLTPIALIFNNFAAFNLCVRKHSWRSDFIRLLLECDVLYVANYEFFHNAEGNCIHTYSDSYLYCLHGSTRKTVPLLHALVDDVRTEGLEEPLLAGV